MKLPWGMLYIRTVLHHTYWGFHCSLPVCCNSLSSACLDTRIVAVQQSPERCNQVSGESNDAEPQSNVWYLHSPPLLSVSLSLCLRFPCLLIISPFLSSLCLAASVTRAFSYSLVHSLYVYYQCFALIRTCMYIFTYLNLCKILRW